MNWCFGIMPLMKTMSQYLMILNVQIVVILLIKGYLKKHLKLIMIQFKECR